MCIVGSIHTKSNIVDTFHSMTRQLLVLGRVRVSCWAGSAALQALHLKSRVILNYLDLCIPRKHYVHYGLNPVPHFYRDFTVWSSLVGLDEVPQRIYTGELGSGIIGQQEVAIPIDQLLFIWMQRRLRPLAAIEHLGAHLRSRLHSPVVRLSASRSTRLGQRCKSFVLYHTDFIHVECKFRPNGSL